MPPRGRFVRWAANFGCYTLTRTSRNRNGLAQRRKSFLTNSSLCLSWRALRLCASKKLNHLSFLGNAFHHWLSEYCIKLLVFLSHDSIGNCLERNIPMPFGESDLFFPHQGFQCLKKPSARFSRFDDVVHQPTVYHGVRVCRRL